jgi:hypothetical protein
MRIVPEVIAKFQRDLWKDQRVLEVVEEGGTKVALVKHYDSIEEAQCEQEVFVHLGAVVGQKYFPEVLQTTRDTTTFKYIYGIRVFNLLVELDSAPTKWLTLSSHIKRQLKSRCEAQQRTIQNALFTLPAVTRKPPYPVEKVRSIVEILSGCLGIEVNLSAIQEELAWLASVWANFVCVPFRDAAPKNMVLASRELWLGNFASEDDRREYIFRSMERSCQGQWLEAPVLDYDFCSCVHNTTPEDDVISIKYHERTWGGPPTCAEDVVWDFSPNAMRAAITFLVRYFRFGGRKAAYRLLHGTGHRIRFRHDNDCFYFQRLPSIISALWPECQKHLPGLLEFTEVLRQHLPGEQADIDYFLAATGKDKRDYYVDMYLG